jgi:flagellar protein FlgJ
LVIKALIEREMEAGGGGMSPYEAARLGLDTQKFNYERTQDAKPDPTDDMREYEYAKGQGYEGSFQDFMISQKRAGAINVTTNVGDDTPADAAFYAGLDKTESEMFGTLAQQAPVVNRAGAQIGVLEQQLAAAPQGAEGAWKAAAGKLGISTEGLSEIQAAQATINSMVPAQRPPGSGTMSDADLALFRESLPQIMNQPGGNQLILGTLKAINAYDQQLSQIATDLVSRKITREQAREAIANIPNPLEDYKQQSATLGNATEWPNAPKIGEVVEGYTYKGGDPAVMGSWEKAQ